MVKLTMAELEKAFPHKKPRPNQKKALQLIANSPKGLLMEMPTGEGKTATFLAALRASAAKGKGPNFYVTTTKTQVEQIAKTHGDKVLVMLGRAEYPCLYYEDLGYEINAEESPCYFLKCSHRVDQETGKVAKKGETPCPYYLQKYLVRHHGKGQVVVTTAAFYLVNRILVPGWQEMEPALVCVDEVHNLPKVARRIFQYTLTDSSFPLSGHAQAN